MSDKSKFRILQFGDLYLLEMEAMDWWNTLAQFNSFDEAYKFMVVVISEGHAMKFKMWKFDIHGMMVNEYGEKID